MITTQLIECNRVVVLADLHWSNRLFLYLRRFSYIYENSFGGQWYLHDYKEIRSLIRIHSDIPMSHTHTHAHTNTHTKQKQHLWLPLVHSCLPSEPALGHLCTNYSGARSQCKQFLTCRSPHTHARTHAHTNFTYPINMMITCDIS